jgi:trimethylamine--corrinoid protein Co-methyltransferase
MIAVQGPKLKILDKNACETIIAAVLKVLWDTGVCIEDDTTRRDLLSRGCVVKEDGFVRLKPDLVHRAAASVPNRMTLFDRNGAVAVDTSGPTPCFGMGLGCVDILDHRTGTHRPYAVNDVREAARLCDALPNIDLATGLGNAHDLSPEDEALATVRTVAGNTVKPVAFTGHDEHEAEAIWSFLADLAGGWPALADHPFALELTGPTSPMTLKSESTRRLIFAARHHLPVVCYPGLFPGATGPITLAGALVQSTAEILAGIVVHQTASPGAPVISGSSILPMDMRTATIAYGAPEYSLACLAAADLFAELGIPTWVGAGCTDAHTLDAQAAAEASAGISQAVYSQSAFIHNLGFLSSGKIGSFEMLVLCDELAGMLKKAAAGVRVDEDTLAAEVIARSAPTMGFLKDPHTKAHVRQEMWIPSFFCRYARGEWDALGGKTALTHIREKLDDILG